jgi:hypothetical protein
MGKFRLNETQETTDIIDNFIALLFLHPTTNIQQSGTLKVKQSLYTP